LAGLLVFITGVGLASKPAVVEPVKAGSSEVQTSRSENITTGTLAKAAELIYSGEFDRAGELAESTASQYDTRFHHLLEVIYEHKAIEKQREAAREAAYAKEMEELEQLGPTLMRQVVLGHRGHQLCKGFPHNFSGY
jgi:hypothetical protein